MNERLTYAEAKALPGLGAYGRTWLYRLYAPDGSLLYIGVTGRLSERFNAHSRSKPWWPEVAEVGLEWLPKMHLALDAERVAIKAEDPRYNRRSVARAA